MAEEMKVAHEVAVTEFARMCAARNVDINIAGMPEADQKQLADHKQKIVSAICRGDLTVATDGTAHFRPPSIPDGTSVFTFYEETDADLMSADAVKGPIEKTVAIATSMTRCNQGAISKLKIRDFNVVCALAALFLD